jgi:hypothetical protein
VHKGRVNSILGKDTLEILRRMDEISKDNYFALGFLQYFKKLVDTVFVV